MTALVTRRYLPTTPLPTKKGTLTCSYVQIVPPLFRYVGGGNTLTMLHGVIYLPTLGVIGVIKTSVNLSLRALPCRSQ